MTQEIKEYSKTGKVPASWTKSEGEGYAEEPEYRDEY